MRADAGIELTTGDELVFGQFYPAGLPRCDLLDAFMISRSRGV